MLELWIPFCVAESLVFSLGVSIILVSVSEPCLADDCLRFIRPGPKVLDTVIFQTKFGLLKVW